MQMEMVLCHFGIISRVGYVSTFWVVALGREAYSRRVV